MGMGWSVSHHYYIHQHVNVQNECYEKKLLVSLKHGIPINPLLKLVNENCVNQYAIITQLSLDSVNSECDCPIHITITNEDSFPKPIVLEFKNYAQRAERELLYKHILNPKTISQYAGLERELTPNNAPDIQAVNDDECYSPTHPLMSFILNNRPQLKEYEEIGDVTEMQSKKTGDRHYVVKSKFVEKCRQFFKDTVLNNLSYTRFENASMELTCDSLDEKDKPVFLTFVVEYFLIDKEDTENRSIKEITDEVCH